MKPVQFKGQTGILAKDQPQYQPLPYRLVEETCVPYGDYRFVTCWRLSFWQRLRILFSGHIWLGQLTFGRGFQPQLPGLKQSDVI